MQARNTQKITKIGFTSILFLLSFLVVFSIYRLKLDDAHLKKMTASNATLQQLITMRNATVQRALLLYRISAMDDPFQRDELYMRFKEQAEIFIKARLSLQRSDKNTQHIKQYKAIQPLMRQTSDIQETTIRLLLAEKFKSANKLLQNDLITTQNKVKNKFSLIINNLREKIDAELLTASKSNRHARTLIATIGFTILILGCIIALYVLRHTRKFEAAIIEQKRIAEEANHSKSSYLANMSHEIRTPLTAIIGFSENISNDELSKKERIKAGNTIIRNGQHLLQLINDILDISKIESGQLEVEKIETSPLQIMDEISSIVSGQITQKGLDFMLDYHFPLPAKIYSDPVRLKQIIINLCSNAIKFTEQGCIHIEVRFIKATNKLAFIIKDTGIGISQQAIKKIFSPFVQADNKTTRKFGGTGLGLTISKQLAKAMNGTLSCSSKTNIGSEFTLELALDKKDFDFITEHNPNATKNTTINSIPKLEGKILLAEDSIDNQELIQMYIEKTGAQLTIVENGEQAVEQGLAKNFQLILMDTQMPVMDGLTAIKLLRAAGYTRAIVSLTANAMQSDKDMCFKAGADNYLAKPIELDNFYTVLKQHLKYIQNTHVYERSKKLQDRMKKLSVKFLRSLPEKINDITDAYSSKDWDALDAASHKLKGLGGAFGYSGITNISKIVNDLTRTKDYFKLDDAITELVRHCNKILNKNAA